ncbi:arginine/agmatine antiporter [Escherichia coli]|nr:arginine/agmatine antiporter [Escherichia coli]
MPHCAFLPRHSVMPHGWRWGDTAGAIVSFCAAAGCLGSLGGWTLLAGQTAKAAADDGLFPPIFARVNKAGTPVAG